MKPSYITSILLLKSKCRLGFLRWADPGRALLGRDKATGEGSTISYSSCASMALRGEELSYKVRIYSYWMNNKHDRTKKQALQSCLDLCKPCFPV